MDVAGSVWELMQVSGFSMQNTAKKEKTQSFVLSSFDVQL
jgi:hypothetical protein